MQPLPARLPGLLILEPAVFPDERGFFCETYRREWHAEAGISAQEEFIQDNHSRSARGVDDRASSNYFCAIADEQRE